MNKILSGFYGEYCNSIWERVNNVLEITNASKRNNELASRLFTTFVLEGNPLQNKEKQKMRITVFALLCDVVVVLPFLSMRVQNAEMYTEYFHILFFLKRALLN